MTPKIRNKSLSSIYFILITLLYFLVYLSYIDSLCSNLDTYLLVTLSLRKGGFHMGVTHETPPSLVSLVYIPN